MQGVRDWTEARAKVDWEGVCRSCGVNDREARLEAAHLVPRSRVAPGPGENPHNIVPLCRGCHIRFDAGALDLLPHLSFVEQAFMVALVGLEEAYRRATGERRCNGTELIV